MTVTEPGPAPLAPIAAEPTRSDWSAVPKVNLLPPEIVQARGFVRLQRRLGAVVVLAVLACGGATWWAQTQVGSAQAELDQARDRTVSLQAEKAKYAEVPQVTAAVEAALSSRERAMASDVLWYRYLNDVALATSSNVWLTSMTVALSGPGAAGPGDPLAPAGIGSVQISGQTTTLPNVGSWLDALDRITGVKGSTLVSATRDTGTGSSGAVTFTTTSVLTQDGLSHRYDRKAG